MKLPWKARTLPDGCMARTAPAATRRMIDSPLITPVAESPRIAPSISSSIAPSTRMSSGRIAWRDGKSRTSGIAVTVSEAEQRRLGGRGCGKRVVIVVDERRHRRRRDVEDRLGIDAEEDGEDHERREDHDLAHPEVANRREGRLFQPAEDDLAVEPERVGRREDQAEGREGRDPVVDLEGADQ